MVLALDHLCHSFVWQSSVNGRIGLMDWMSVVTGSRGATGIPAVGGIGVAFMVNFWMNNSFVFRRE